MYPLGPTCDKVHHFDTKQLQDALDSFKRGLYEELKQGYLDFVSHLEAAEQAGNLTIEAAKYWTGWMQSLQTAIKKKFLPEFRQHESWPTLQVARLLVSLPFSSNTSVTDADLACTQLYNLDLDKVSREIVRRYFWHLHGCQLLDLADNTDTRTNPKHG